jgi:SAM-dependent methyltransferase
MTRGGEPYEVLGERYDDWVISVVEDVPWYRSVARGAAIDCERPVDVLELGAGSGRITMPLAAEAEAVRSIVALDASPAQAARLRERVAAEQPSAQVEVVVGDMRELDAHVAARSLDLVVAPFRSLLHVAPDRDEVFARVAAALRPGGVFAFDVYHPHEVGIEEVDGRWMLRRRWAEGDATVSVWERARFDLPAGELHLDVRVERSGEVEREATMLLHVPPIDAWRDALERAGFAVELTVAWFDGLPSEPGDEDSVWIARLPEG